jgi:hypothetical protein
MAYRLSTSCLTKLATNCSSATDRITIFTLYNVSNRSVCKLASKVTSVAGSALRKRLVLFNALVPSSRPTNTMVVLTDASPLSSMSPITPGLASRFERDSSYLDCQYSHASQPRGPRFLQIHRRLRRQARALIVAGRPAMMCQHNGISRCSL